MNLKLDHYVNVDGHCGGHQRWWGLQTVGNHYGCGVITALDSLIYYGLISEPSSIEGYMEEANRVWTYIRPNTGWRHQMPNNALLNDKGFGVYSVRKFRKGIQSYLRHHHREGTFYQLNNGRMRYRDKDIVTFVTEALASQCPVQILLHKDKTTPYSFHWITIIGLETVDDQVRARIVTWGKEAFIDDFQEFWRYKGLLSRKYAMFYQIKATQTPLR